MKKIAVLAFLALGFSATAQQVDFKVEYKPATTYTQKMDINMNLGFVQGEGGEAFEQPMDMAMIYTIKTAKAAANGDVPFTANMNMESELVPNTEEMSKIKFMGRFPKDAAPVVDSVNSGGMQMGADQLKDAFAKAVSQFPAKGVKLKVGENFKVNNLPMDLGNINLGENSNLNVTYTLKKVEGNKAIFDIFMDSPLDIETQGIAMKGKIKMTGVMTYLTDAKYVSGQDIDMDAAFNMSQQGMDMKMTIKGKNKVTTTVTAN